MIIRDVIYRLGIYINARSSMSIPAWALAEDVEQAKAMAFARYSQCTIVSPTYIRKQVLSVDKRSISSSIFEVEISTAPKIYTPTIFVLADYTDEVIDLCTKRYSAALNIDINLMEGMVLPDVC